MTNAIILSAGQGKRLLPLTETRPKCMLAVAGKPILEWQVAALLAAKIDRISIITGFNSGLIEEHINDRFGADLTGLTSFSIPSTVFPTTWRVAGWPVTQWTGIFFY